MNLLFDSHSFIWWDSDQSQLSPAALAACLDPANRLFLSSASVWELQIKYQLGKLTLNKPLDQIVRDQLRGNRIQLLPIKLAHIFGLQLLPHHHRDPFDRMLIAQTMTEQYTLVGCDHEFAAYGIPLLW